MSLESTYPTAHALLRWVPRRYPVFARQLLAHLNRVEAAHQAAGFNTAAIRNFALILSVHHCATLAGISTPQQTAGASNPDWLDNLALQTFMALLAHPKPSTATLPSFADA